MAGIVGRYDILGSASAISLHTLFQNPLIATIILEPLLRIGSINLPVVSSKSSSIIVAHVAYSYKH